MLGQYHRSKAGFSLVEMVVLIVIVSLAVPPITVLLSQVLSSNAQLHMQAKAAELAKGLMEEVLSKEFEDPQGESGSFGTEEAARTNYDDIDDFDGFVVSPPTDSQGNVLSGFSAFRLAVTVENVAADAPGGAAVSDGSTDFKRVTVTVSWSSGGSRVRLVGMAGDLGGDDDAGSTLSGLTFVSRSNSNDEEDIKFYFRNDSGSAFYATHIMLTWTSPTAYYKEVKFKVEGGTNHSKVWKSDNHNDVRIGSGEIAMFNQGKLVLIPADALVKVEVKDFYTAKVGGSKADVEDTTFEVEIYAAPDMYQPFTVTAEP
jgi:MSHA pilin protein MshD